MQRFRHFDELSHRRHPLAPFNLPYVHRRQAQDFGELRLGPLTSSPSPGDMGAELSAQSGVPRGLHPQPTIHQGYPGPTERN